MSLIRGDYSAEPGAMLVLHVRRMEQGPGLPSRYVYEWRTAPAERVAPLQQDFSVEITDSVVEAFCSRISATVERSLDPERSAPTDHATELRVAGALLFKTLFPRFENYVADLADRLRASREPLLVCTNESLVPWELLHDGDDFLGLTRDMGRQDIVGTRVALGQPCDAIGRALLVADPMRDLPEAEAETRQLSRWLTEHGVSCTTVAGPEANLVRVLSELTDRKYDLFHYSGHAAIRERSREAALVLADKQALDVRTIRSVCSAGAPPVVFLNACASADRLSNLCAAFMTVGSQVAVGTQYRVSEHVARGFAERFYADLVKGVPAGAAVRDARRLVSVGMDAAWAAFVLFGDPTVRIRPVGGNQAEPAAAEPATAGRPVPLASEPPPAVHLATPVSVPGPADRRPHLARETAAVLEGVIASAEPHGRVTSLDLLVGLLAGDTPLRQLCMQAGIDPDALRRRALQVLARAPTVPSAGVRLSPTVAAALAAMPAMDHDPLTLDDLCRAFADTKGGGAGRLLAAAGVPLEHLRTSIARVPLTERGPSSLFGGDGRLLVGYLEPAAEAAFRHAKQLAHDHGGVISTAALLAGFGQAGSTRLRQALLEQGEPGAAAVALLFRPAATPPAEQLTDRDISPRVRGTLDRALRRARIDETPLVSDSAVLCALLRDRAASARTMLTELGIDSVRLTTRLRAGATAPPVASQEVR